MENVCPVCNGERGSYVYDDRIAQDITPYGEVWENCYECSSKGYLDPQDLEKLSAKEAFREYEAAYTSSHYRYLSYISLGIAKLCIFALIVAICFNQSFLLLLPVAGFFVVFVGMSIFLFKQEEKRFLAYINLFPQEQLKFVGSSSYFQGSIPVLLVVGGLGLLVCVGACVLQRNSPISVEIGFRLFLASLVTIFIGKLAGEETSA